MKVRTCVLFACMTVVPGLAMFSHHVPADLRHAARCLLWQPVAAWLRPAAHEVAAPTAPPAAPVARKTRAPAPSAAVPPVAKDRLVRLGAVGIEVRQLDGVSAVHVASCRVAMDAAGQLHRVFQAPGSGPGEAIEALAEQVEAWHDRLAVRAMAVDRAPGAR